MPADPVDPEYHPDELSMKILEKLMKDPRKTPSKIAKSLGVKDFKLIYSRFKELVQKKVIKKFAIELDPSVLNLNYVYLIEIRIVLPPQENLCTFWFDMMISYLRKNFSGLRFVGTTDDNSIIAIAEFGDEASMNKVLTRLQSSKEKLIESVTCRRITSIESGTSLFSYLNSETKTISDDFENEEPSKPSE